MIFSFRLPLMCFLLIVESKRQWHNGAVFMSLGLLKKFFQERFSCFTTALCILCLSGNISNCRSHFDCDSTLCAFLMPRNLFGFFFCCTVMKLLPGKFAKIILDLGEELAINYWEWITIKFVCFAKSSASFRLCWLWKSWVMLNDWSD